MRHFLYVLMVTTALWTFPSCGTDSTTNDGSTTATETTDQADSTDETTQAAASDASDTADTSTDQSDSTDQTDNTGTTTSTDNTDATVQTDGTDTTDSTDAADKTDGTDSTDATDSTDTTDKTDGTDSTDATDATDMTDAADKTDGTDSTDATDATDGADTTDTASIALILEDWYDNYNQGKGTDYLKKSYETQADGNPKNTPSHVFHSTVNYGPYDRNVLDFWEVKGTDKPSPVVVYIHGGGYVTGSKNKLNDNPQTVDRFLKAGVSVASISYRYAFADAEMAVDAKIPNGPGNTNKKNGTRLDYIMRDCARSIQFLRYKATDWNIDKTKIAAYGGSAGAACALWVGTVPDLANPNHSDPVLHESSRLIAVGHTNSQVSMNWQIWPEHLQMDADFVFGHIQEKAIGLSQLSWADQKNKTFGKLLNKLLDYYDHLTPDDMAFYTQNSAPDTPQSEIKKSSEIIHHPRGHVALYKRCVSQGLTCHIKTTIEDSDYKGDIVTFMIEHLTK